MYSIIIHFIKSISFNEANHTNRDLKQVEFRKCWDPHNLVETSSEEEEKIQIDK